MNTPTAGPFTRNHEQPGWLHTGDRGLVDSRGHVHVLGRVGDTIMTGGEKVDPLEVENLLCPMPGVVDIAVLGVPDPHWGEIVTVVLVVADGRDVELADIRAHLHAQLMPYKHPRSVVVVDQIPRTSTGKVRRSELVRRIQD